MIKFRVSSISQRQTHLAKTLTNVVLDGPRRGLRISGRNGGQGLAVFVGQVRRAVASADDPQRRPHLKPERGGDLRQNRLAGFGVEPKMKPVIVFEVATDVTRGNRVVDKRVISRQFIQARIACPTSPHLCQVRFDGKSRKSKLVKRVSRDFGHANPSVSAGFQGALGSQAADRFADWCHARADQSGEQVKGIAILVVVE